MCRKILMLMVLPGNQGQALQSAMHLDSAFVVSLDRHEVFSARHPQA